MINELRAILDKMEIPYTARRGRSGLFAIELETVYWQNAVVLLNFNPDGSFKNCEIKGDDSMAFQNIIDDKIVSIMKNLTDAIERSKQ